MDLKHIFNEFNNKNVMIVGDAMIDKYMWGEINRISPEAPVPIVDIKTHENRLGGAANVALNIKSLGANPILCTVIGDRERGKTFKKLMKEAKISTVGILTTKDRKTTTKTRVIANNLHQLRIDEEETTPIKNSKEFLRLTISLMKNVDVIILQDYNKGVLTFEVIENLILNANKKNIPIIVDPKEHNFLSYKNCTIFKPNLMEIKSGMQTEFDEDNLSEIKKATSDLREKISAKAILLTLSEKGICVNSKNKFTHTPIFKRNIIDVSGAGDTVISVASLCLATNINYTNLSILSNLAGGIVCEKVGVVTIDKETLLKEAIKHLN